jgi:2-dehydropantoate 2-reductase
VNEGRVTSKIAVVGAGAIGGWIAARLAMYGAAVTVVAQGETLQSIQQSGLTLTEGGEPTTIEVAAMGAGEVADPQDVVIFSVKAPSLSAAAGAARPLIGAGTLILPILNGVPWWFTADRLHSVDPSGAIAAALPMSQIVGCVVHASCFRTAPNKVVVKHADKLIVGEPQGGPSNRVAALCDLFEGAGIRCEASPNIRRAIWYKLWGNATINPLSALTRATADRLLEDPDIHAMMAEAMDELAAVGAAIGCPISESADDRMAVTARLGAFKSSMLQDVEQGRPIELEVLLGAPREIAKRLGIPTPQLDRLYALTRLMAEYLCLLG